MWMVDLPSIGFLSHVSLILNNIIVLNVMFTQSTTVYDIHK